MTHKLIKMFQYGFVVLAVLVVAYLMGVQSMLGNLARAAGLVFKTDCVTATATSTIKYMTFGTATTTVTCPMGNDGADSAVLAIQVNASSTLSHYQIYVEESMDGQDYYPVPFSNEASTTLPFSLSMRPYADFLFASSTIGGTSGLNGASTTFAGYTALNNRNHYELDIPVRMKWVRTYATIATTSIPDTGNGAIWMQIIPKISN